MKTYRYCYCGGRHKTHRTLAKCLWRRALWISGNGPYAVLAWCHGDPTVSLHASYADATAALERIDGECGGKCVNEHEVIRLAQTVGTRSQF